MKTRLATLLLCLLCVGLIACGESKPVTVPEETITDPAEVAPPTQVTAPAPAEIPAPSETPAPADVAAPVADPAPADVATPADVPAPTAIPAPAEVPVPAFDPTPAEVTATTDIAAPDVAVSVDIAIPVAIQLKPYSAVYSSSFNGMDAEMKRSLKQTGENLWQLRNSASILFFDLEEKAQFSTAEAVLTPLSYDYRNNMSSKRNSKLRFDASQQTALDSLHSKKPLALPPNSFDKLSYQTHLRMELLQNQGQLRSETLHLVDRTKLKSYQFSQLGTELIETPAGRFNSVKLSQSRTGKDEHTLIWLATDWDYFVLRIQRVEDGKVEFQVDLNSAIIDGQAIQGL